MLGFNNCHWLFLWFVSAQCNITYVIASWPSLNSSSIRLLSLFQYTPNTSFTISYYAQYSAMFKAAIILSHQYNMTIAGEFIGWQSEKTTGNVIDTLRDACYATSLSNIVGIVGPTLSRETRMISAFGSKIGIPVISNAATDPVLSDRKTYPNFYRTVPSDNKAALALVKLFIRFNWTSCIIIYQNDEFGSGGYKAITEAFSDNDLDVRQTIEFDITTLRIQGDLTTYIYNAGSRIIIVWAEPFYTSLILKNALDSAVVGPYFTWILSSSISLNSFNSTYNQAMIGMLLIEPVVGAVINVPINTILLNAAYQIWQEYEPESFPGSMNVDSYAYFAFDATWTLIQSLQNLCSSMSNQSSSCLSINQSSICFDRRFIYSKLLLDAVSKTEFLGVSGPIKFSMNSTDRINGSYYSVKNAQLSTNGFNFVPVLEYSDPDNWRLPLKENIIVWPGNTLTVPTSRAMLKGITLRIGVIESVPFTIVQTVLNASGVNTTQLSGYVVDLIEQLKNKIGFIPIVQIAASNQTYSKLVQAVNDGLYDIVIGDVTVTSQRREIVSFSNGIFDNSLRIIMRQTSDVEIDLLSFLRPFSRGLWLLLLVAWIYAGILICIMERNDNEALQNRSILSQILLSIWFSFGNIVGYGVDFDINTAAGRLLTAGLYLLCLILVATYTANLASELTLSKSKNLIAGIDDIKSGKIPFNRIGIRVGTAGEDYYLREISGGNRNFYSLKTRKELYDSLLAGVIDASFMDSGVAEYATNNVYCNLTLIGTDFDKGVFGIVTPKQWIYSQDLDVNILSLKESGVLDNLKQKWFQGEQCPDSSGKSTAIGIEATYGLFLVFAVISILSLLLFVWMKRLKLKKSLIQMAHRKNSNRKQQFVENQLNRPNFIIENHQVESGDLTKF